MPKRYISAQELLELSYKLGNKVLSDNFQPKFIIGIWRGGAPVGIALQEFLKYFGVKSDHISIRTSSYSGVGENAQQSHEIRVHGLEYVVEHANASDSILLVDDIFDSGRSVKAIIDNLKHKMRLNTPHDIRVATVCYKPKNNKTNIVPNYYVEETEAWVVFPHELEEMSLDEIRKTKGDVVGDLVDSILFES